MAKVHTTLKPSTNIAMILIWGIIAGTTAYISRPYSYPVAFMGLLLGVICGIMQYYAFMESKKVFLDSTTMMEVRRRLVKTKWGKRYIPFLWISQIILVIIVLLLWKGNLIVEIMAGQFTLMFFREIITLKPTFELDKLSKESPEQPL